MRADAEKRLERIALEGRYYQIGSDGPVRPTESKDASKFVVQMQMNRIVLNNIKIFNFNFKNYLTYLNSI